MCVRSLRYQSDAHAIDSQLDITVKNDLFRKGSFLLEILRGRGIILDKIMLIERSCSLIEQKFSKEMNKESLEHFKRISRSMDTIYEYVKINQSLKNQ